MVRRAIFLLLFCCSSTKENIVPALSERSEDCASCHKKEWEEWQKSRHSKSYVDKVFQSEFNPQRSPWCAACHAPLAKDPTEVKDDDPLASQGVGCLACHRKEGA